MSKAYDAYYVFRPTEALQEVLKDYPETSIYIKDVQVWKKNESYSTPDEDKEMQNHILSMKLSLLLKLIRYYELGFDEEVIHRLFGNPVCFDIATFDKWWTIDRSDTGSTFREMIETSTAKHFALLEKTGEPDVDSWLEWVIELKKREEAADTDE